eukprot:COSAG04_NODE_90_length_26856_cov_18.273723_10_plen_77_part_00
MIQIVYIFYLCNGCSIGTPNPSGGAAPGAGPYTIQEVFHATLLQKIKIPKTHSKSQFLTTAPPSSSDGAPQSRAPA